MSWDQQRGYNNERNDRDRGGHRHNRNQSHVGSDGPRINKGYNNDGGNRYHNDNRGGYGRGRGGEGWRGGGGGGRNNSQFGGRGSGGGGGRGGFDPNAPKKLPGNMMPRKEEPIEPSVLMAQQLMTRLGDYTAIAEDEVLCDNIKALGNTFVSVGDLKLFPEEIAGVFVKCFSQLSVQAPILATLLSLVHQQEGEFSALVTERIGQRLIQAVAEDDVPTAKILLRSVACLSACGSFDAEGPGGLLEVLQGLLDVLMADLADPINADATSALQLSPSAQAATFLLANTLVWAAPSLRTCASSFLSAAQAALQSVVARWCSPYAVGGLQAIFNAFSGAAAEDGMDADGNGVGADGIFETVLSVGPSALAGRGQTVLADGSAWDSLWDSAAQACAVLEELKACTEQGKEYEYPAYMNAQWVVLSIEGLLTGAETKLSFGGHFAAEWAAQLQGLGSRATRCTPAGAVASVLGASSSSAWLRARLTIFDAETSQDCALCCAMSPHAKHVARSYLEDVLTFFDPVVNEDGTLLGSMELLTSHLLAVFKLFPEQAHLEYLLVETLFQLLLQAPTNTALSASVFRLVLELCRRSSQVFPPVVALGANTVFQLVPDLDASSALEFGRWFSFHLINTQLSWPQHYWDFWVGEVAEAEAAGLRTVPLFLRSVVERLSFAVIPDKLRPALPQALHALIPPSGPANCPLLAPSGGESMLSHLPGIAALASQLKTQIESKADPEDVTDWLEAQEVPQEDEAQAVCWRGCLLLQVLADVAVSSNDSALSAVVGLLDRYSEPLLVHAASEQDHTDLLHMLREVYGGNNYMHSYILDEMMRRSQISVCAAAAWLCGPDAAGRARWVSDPLTYGAVASVAERAVDFVKAAVAQRSQLGGGFRLDEAADLTPSAAPERAAGQAGTGRKRAAEEEGAGAMEAEEDDGDERHKRSRRGEDAADDVLGSADVAPEEGAGGAEGGMVMDASTPGAAQVEDEDQEDDPLWVADEALKSALRNARAVFATTTGTFRQAIAAPNAEEGADVSYVAASLLRRILRVYRGTERHLSHQQQVAAVLSAPDAQTHALLVQVGSGATGSQAGIAAQRWLAQLQR